MIKRTSPWPKKRRRIRRGRNADARGRRPRLHLRLARNNVNYGGNAWETPAVLAEIYLYQIYLAIPTASIIPQNFYSKAAPKGFHESGETFRPNPTKEN